MRQSSQKIIRAVVILATLLLTLSLLSACTLDSKGSGQVAPGGAPEEASPSAETPLNLAVYYVKITDNDAYLVREVHQVPYTREVAKAALEEIIKGSPVTTGASRVLPPETIVRGISVKDGNASVDFSSEVLKANVGAAGEALGIQSIVNTLTEFPEIKQVSFWVDGKLDERTKDWWGHVGLYNQPFKRDVSAVYEPVIWVTSPKPSQKITSPLQIHGSARVFEATVNARIIDNSGKELAQGYATASEGAPGRGDFEFSLPFTPTTAGSGKVEVFWASPKDGEELDKVVVPVTW
ncbi:MAG: Gmad2 immunoglobulin-like domain-containing protein [Desulfotomaculaceae bacterium]|nr:Gmad2 immunoglobulin-like domain-containing protein [Desulfotomaculaceae bacterium]